MRMRKMPPCMSPMPGDGHTVAKSFSKPFSMPAGQFGFGATGAGGGAAAAALRPPPKPRPPPAGGHGVNAP